MTAEDINIGWGAILETFEMRLAGLNHVFSRYSTLCSIFGFVHIKAFSYKPYRPHTPDAKRTPRLRSFAHAMDFRETFREFYVGAMYMWRRMRGVETDPLARRIAVLENAFEKSRAEVGRGNAGEATERVLEVGTSVEVEVAVDGERQWLGVGDEYGYGISRRERSEALDIQFESEIEKRGYGRSSEYTVSHILLITTHLWLLDPGLGANVGHGLAYERKRQSWWRSTYERVSQSHAPHEVSQASPSPSKRKSRSRPTSRQHVRVYEDQPPPSILRTYRDNRTASQELASGTKAPQLPKSAMSQDLPDLSMQGRYPRFPVSAAVSRADTVLDRLFSNQPPRSDGGHTSQSGGTSVAPPSSQSHRTHLPLNAAPLTLPQNVDAGRPVEVAMRHPGSPSSNVAQELRAEPTVLPTSPPPMQRPQERLNRSGTAELPPPPPPKDIRGTLHRRELAHFQPSSERANFASAPIVPAVPAPNSGSDPERITTPPNAEERLRHTSPLADMRDLPELTVPSPVSRRPARPRTDDAALTAGGARSLRSRAPMRVVSPMHTFNPEPPRRPRLKGTPRMDHRMSPLALRPSSFPLNYSLYHLPNARFPPSTPRADQTLLQRQDS
jgi:hypothetical protein